MSLLGFMYMLQWERLSCFSEWHLITSFEVLLAWPLPYFLSSVSWLSVSWIVLMGTWSRWVLAHMNRHLSCGLCFVEGFKKRRF